MVEAAKAVAVDITNGDKARKWEESNAKVSALYYTRDEWVFFKKNLN